MSKGEEDLRKQSEDEEKLQSKPQSEEFPTVPANLESRINNLKGGGQPLEPTIRAFFEPRIGHDFSYVRVHTGNNASKIARSINARAFTVNKNIVMGAGEYQPRSARGLRLLGHELTHVVQQSIKNNPNSVKRLRITSRKSSTPLISRTTHGRGGAAYTPTNCANPLIPLSPRMAGIAAHAQIDGILAALGIHPQAIPRATKRRMSTINPPFGTNLGFADLWTVNAGMVRIAETKSTNIGHGRARREASHYVRRHNEWNLRWPNAFPDDATYRFIVGAHPVPGTVLNLFPFTGTGLALGTFIADPGKLLFAEGDTLGAMVYWCQGPGIINPMLVWLLKQALDRMRDFLDRLKEEIKDFFDNLPPAPTPEEVNRLIAYLLLFVAVVLALVAIACLAGVITSPCAPFAAGGAIVAGAMALILLGINIPGITTDRDPLLATLRKENYSRPGGGCGATEEGIARSMIASLSNLTNASAITSRAAGNLDQTQARTVLRRAIRELRTVGRTDEASFVSHKLSRVS